MDESTVRLALGSLTHVSLLGLLLVSAVTPVPFDWQLFGVLLALDVALLKLDMDVPLFGRGPGRGGGGGPRQ
jgi:hypothetical protein